MEWKELRKKTVLVGLTLNQYIGGGGRGGWVLPKRVDSVFEGGSYPQCTLWVRRGDGGF